MLPSIAVLLEQIRPLASTELSASRRTGAPTSSRLWVAGDVGWAAGTCERFKPTGSRRSGLAVRALDFPTVARRNYRPELRAALANYETTAREPTRANTLPTISPLPFGRGESRGEGFVLSLGCMGPMRLASRSGRLRVGRDAAKLDFGDITQAGLLPHPPVGPLSRLGKPFVEHRPKRAGEHRRLQLQHGRLRPAQGPPALRETGPWAPSCCLATTNDSPPPTGASGRSSRTRRLNAGSSRSSAPRARALRSRATSSWTNPGWWISRLWARRWRR